MRQGMRTYGVARICQTCKILPRHKNPVGRYRLILVNAFEYDRILLSFGNIHQSRADKIQSLNASILQNVPGNNRVRGVAIIECDQAWNTIRIAGKFGCAVCNLLHIFGTQNPMMFNHVIDEFRECLALIFEDIMKSQNAETS